MLRRCRRNRCDLLLNALKAAACCRLKKRLTNPQLRALVANRISTREGVRSTTAMSPALTPVSNSSKSHTARASTDHKSLRYPNPKDLNRNAQTSISPTPSRGSTHFGGAVACQTIWPSSSTATRTGRGPEASRAAAIAAFVGRIVSISRAMASGSTTIVPRPAIAAGSVLFPEPFGPATRVNVGISASVGRDLAQHYHVGLARSGRIESDFKSPPFRIFGYITSSRIAVHNIMSRLEGSRACFRAGVFHDLDKFIAEDALFDHRSHYRLVHHVPALFGCRLHPSTTRDPAARRYHEAKDEYGVTCRHQLVELRADRANSR